MENVHQLENILYPVGKTAEKAICIFDSMDGSVFWVPRPELPEIGT